MTGEGSPLNIFLEPTCAREQETKKKTNEERNLTVANLLWLTQQFVLSYKPWYSVTFSFYDQFILDTRRRLPPVCAELKRVKMDVHYSSAYGALQICLWLWLWFCSTVQFLQVVHFKHIGQLALQHFCQMSACTPKCCSWPRLDSFRLRCRNRNTSLKCKL